MKNSPAIYTPTLIEFGYSVVNLEQGKPVACTFIDFGLVERVSANHNMTSICAVTGAIIRLDDGQLLGVPLQELKIQQATLPVKCQDCDGELFEEDKDGDGADFTVKCRFCQQDNTFHNHFRSPSEN